jgi:glutamate synthase (NADPH/NADH) small chain
MNKTCVAGTYEELQAAERNLSDFCIAESLLTPRPGERATSGEHERIAVIGAGPAGLCAANILVRLGYRVTIFERLPVIAGMLAVGIPAVRQPAALMHQLATIARMPEIEIHLSTTIGRDLTFWQLREHVAAILLAVGAQHSVPVDIPGETMLDGVIPALQFLQQCQLGPYMHTRGEVAVIGGGWATLEAAHQAASNGAHQVRIFLPGTPAQLPASPAACARAAAQGILFHAEEMPRSILGTEDASVHGLRCQKTRREAGQALTYLPEVNYWYLADTVLLALGEQVDLSFAPEVQEQLALSDRTGREHCCMVLPGVFVAGDAASSSPQQRCLQHALTDGYTAAHLIHHALCTQAAVCNARA